MSGCARHSQTGSGRRCRAGVGRDLVPAVAGLQAAQGKDAGRARCRPSHAGQFQALAGDGLAGSFYCARADEHAEGLEVVVAHRCLEFAGLAAGQGEGAGGGADGGNVAVVEVGEPGVQPAGFAGAEHELQQFRQVVQVLAGVIEVDDRGGLGYLKPPPYRPTRPAAGPERLESAWRTWLSHASSSTSMKWRTYACAASGAARLPGGVVDRPGW